MTSVELYSARYVEDGFVAEEVWLSTDAKPIKIVRTNFALSPLRGSHVAVLRQLKGRKEGVCVCVCVDYYAIVLLKADFL